jgi:hypothetical protein
MVWALEVARICLATLGYAAAAWAVGFGMGYRRGVSDAINGSIPKPDHSTLTVVGEPVLVASERTGEIAKAPSRAEAALAAARAGMTPLDPTRTFR